MIAALLAADGRAPVHNRAGSNMTWGVATALLEQDGREGLFEVDEAWLPRVAAAARPLADRPRQPLPRPARPLRRDGGAGRRVGEGGRRARRVDPLRAQRRRPADRRPRPRRRGAPARRASSTSGSTTPSQALRRAPARLRRQALPPLRPPLRLRARLRRPPRPLLLPQLRRRAPPARRGGDGDRAARHGRLAGHGPHPGRRAARSTCPSPASTTSTTRSRLSPPGSSSGVAPERIAAALGGMRAAFGRVETIEVAGEPVSILLIKNPAGANEVLRTLRLEAGGEGLDLWIALNDRIADGRDVSWIWDADFELLEGAVRRVVCAGTRAPEMALRLKYAGWPLERIEVEPEIEASLDRAVAGAEGRLFALPTYTALLELRKLLAGARAGGGVLAVSAAADLARRRVRRLRGRPGALGGAGRRSRRGRFLTWGAGPAGSALHLARRGHRVVGLDRGRRSACCFWRAGGRAACGGGAWAMLGGSSWDASSGWCLLPCSSCSFSREPSERVDCLRCVAGASEARRDRRAGDRRGGAGGRGGVRRRCPTCARSMGGSIRACRSRPASRTARSWSGGCGRSSRRRAS